MVGDQIAGDLDKDYPDAPGPYESMSQFKTRRRARLEREGKRAPKPPRVHPQGKAGMVGLSSSRFSCE